MSKPIFNNLFESFQYIRSNPLEYLPEKSLSLFRAFWDGYSFRYDCESKDETIFNLPRGFYNFIDKKYQNETTHGPFNVIKLYSRNEAEAFDNFFIYLDEFIKKENLNETAFYVKKEERYKTTSFFDFLKDIRKRPAMYVSTNSFTLVAEMIHGWLRAIEDFQLDKTQEEQTFRRFQKYIEENSLPVPSPPWNKIIWYWTMNEEDSIIKFFEWFDEFAFQGTGLIKGI